MYIFFYVYTNVALDFRKISFISSALERVTVSSPAYVYGCLCNIYAPYLGTINTGCVSVYHELVFIIREIFYYASLHLTATLKRSHTVHPRILFVRNWISCFSSPENFIVEIKVTIVSTLNNYDVYTLRS